MNDKNKEALKQQPLFKNEELEKKKNLYANPVFAQPLGVIQKGEEEEDDTELEEEMRNQVGELVQKEAKPFKQEMEKKEDSKQGIGTMFKARKRELAIHSKRKKEADKAVRQALSTNAYLNLIDSMESSLAMEKDELHRFVMKPDLKKMKDEHKIKTRTRTIKHTIKADEVITERIVENKKEKVEAKKENAHLLSENETMVRDAMIKLRKSVDINDKKGMDYTDFEELSVFGIKMRDGALSELSKLYSEGERIKKGNALGDRKDMTYAALNMMTAEIMKLDESAYDVHTDESLVKQSAELSTMSLMVRSYQNFLSKNPDYIDYLSKQKDEGGSMADRMYTKLARLSAIGQYYRLRKIVLEDPYYLEHANEEIPMTEENGDSVQIKRLKKMMLASAQAAANLQNIFGSAKVSDIRLKSGRHSDMLGTLSMEQVTDLSKLSEEDRVKSIKSALNGLSASNLTIRQLESESFFQAPMWLQNALTLDPEAIKKKGLDKNYALASKLSMSVEQHLPDHMDRLGSKHSGRDKELLKEYYELRKKYGKLGSSYEKKVKEAKGKPVVPELTDYIWDKTAPAFEGAFDEEVGKLTLSDNWMRIENSICGAFAYKRTHAEVLEMIEHLRIQENKEEWEKVKNDREARVFYESSYKEAARKFLFSEYAAAKRLDETVNAKLLAMHPTDLLYQATPALHAAILQAATISNAFVMNQRGTIKRLFEEDKTGNYSFDSNEANVHNDMSSSQNFKLTGLMDAICDVLAGSYEGDAEICRKLYGSGDMYKKKILPAFKKAKAEGDYLATVVVETKAADIAWWYLSKHPELLDRKYLHKKSGGRFVLQHVFNSLSSIMIDGGEKSFREGLKKGYVDIPGNEELDKYQEYLTKEGYPKTRTEETVEFDEVEEEVKVEEIDPQMKVKLEGCKTKVVTGAEIRKNRREDPYGLNLIKNKFSELTYIDDEGKERMKNIKVVF